MSGGIAFTESTGRNLEIGRHAGADSSSLVDKQSCCIGPYESSRSLVGSPHGVADCFMQLWLHAKILGKATWMNNATRGKGITYEGNRAD